jgi:molybdopterin-guanine dinucleotide biosynthesis protein A
MSFKENVTGLVLSGGQARRMGGIDKGLQLLDGKKLVIHAIERLIPQTATILVNANRHLQVYEKIGFPVITDEFEDFAGPLAGFHAGLVHCKTPFMVAVPCDAPFYPENLVSKLKKALLEKDADIAIAVTGKKPPLTHQPVFCLMKKKLHPHLRAFLKTGQRKIDQWNATLAVAHAHFENESEFYNINTLQDLQNLTLSKSDGQL